MIYVLIETADLNLLSVRLYKLETAARSAFDATCAENFDITPAPDDNLTHEAEGTIAIVGDEAYCVQLLARPFINELPGSPAPDRAHALRDQRDS